MESSLSLSQLYDQAFATAADAKRSDSAAEDPNASFNLYLEAAQLFTQARARERNPKRQKLIFDNATELITRAEQIREETNKGLVETLKLQKEMHEEMGDSSTAREIDEVSESIGSLRRPVFTVKDLAQLEKIPLSAAFVLLEVLGGDDDVGELDDELNALLGLDEEPDDAGPSSPNQSPLNVPHPYSHSFSHALDSSRGSTPLSDPSVSHLLSSSSRASTPQRPPLSPNSRRAMFTKQHISPSSGSNMSSSSSLSSESDGPGGRKPMSISSDDEASPVSPYHNDQSSKTKKFKGISEGSGGSGDSDDGVGGDELDDCVLKIPVNSLKSFQNDISSRNEEISRLEDQVASLQQQLRKFRKGPPPSAPLHGEPKPSPSVITRQNSDSDLEERLRKLQDIGGGRSSPSTPSPRPHAPVSISEDALGGGEEDYEDVSGQLLLSRPPPLSPRDPLDDGYTPDALSILSELPAIPVSSPGTGNDKNAGNSHGSPTLDELDDLEALLSMPLSPVGELGPPKEPRESISDLQDSIDDLESCVQQLAASKQQPREGEGEDEDDGSDAKDVADAEGKRRHDESLQAAQREIESMRRELSSQESGASLLRQQLVRAHTECGAANAKLPALQAALDLKVAEHAALKAAYDEQVAKLARVEGEFEQFSALTRAELAKERDASAELKSDLDACKSDLDACKSDLEACKSDLDACKSDLDACKSDLDARKAASTALESSSAELQSDLDVCRAALSACKIDKQQTEERATRLESDLKSAASTHEGVAEEKAKVAKELADLRERIEEGEFPLNDAAECTVCMEKTKSIALRPCGHLVVCEDCLFSLGKEKDRKCPICRSAVRGHLRVFFS